MKNIMDLDLIVYTLLNFLAYKICGFEAFCVIHVALYGYYHYWKKEI